MFLYILNRLVPRHTMIYMYTCKSRILNLILMATGIQCSFSNTSVICSYLCVPVKKQALFCAYRSLFI